MRKSSGEVGNGGERTEHRLAEFGHMVEVSERFVLGHCRRWARKALATSFGEVES